MISEEDERTLLKAILNRYWAGENKPLYDEYLKIIQYRDGVFDRWWTEAKHKATEGDPEMQALVAEYIKLRITS